MKGQSQECIDLLLRKLTTASQVAFSFLRAFFWLESVFVFVFRVNFTFKCGSKYPARRLLFLTLNCHRALTGTASMFNGVFNTIVLCKSVLMNNTAAVSPLEVFFFLTHFALLTCYQGNGRGRVCSSSGMSSVRAVMGGVSGPPGLHRQDTSNCGEVRNLQNSSSTSKYLSLLNFIYLRYSLVVHDVTSTRQLIRYNQSLFSL